MGSSGIRPVCHTQIIREYTYAYSAISPVDGMIESLIAPVATTEVMEIFLRQVSNRFPDENVIMIMDKAAWHTTENYLFRKISPYAFCLPYSPQLNRWNISGKSSAELFPIGSFEI